MTVSQSTRAPSAQLAVDAIIDWASANGLVVRHNVLTGAGAVFDHAGGYRYLIWRGASPALPFIGFGMLNPSTAGFEHDDATSIRNTKRATQLRAGGWLGWNLFAYCATDPKQMKLTRDPVGPLNDAAINLALSLCGMTVAAWGTDGGHLGRSADVLRRCAAARAELRVLGLTKDGHPRHPLYVAGHVIPWVWEGWA